MRLVKGFQEQGEGRVAGEREKVQASLNRVGFSGGPGPGLMLAAIKGTVSDGSSFMISSLLT